MKCKTRGTTECVILDKARTASLLNGLKHVLCRPVLLLCKPHSIA